MDDNYFLARDNMKWDVSPFKVKDFNAFVTTPRSKWSTLDNDERSIFRSRLHSSPFLDIEKIKKQRPVSGECAGPPPSPQSDIRVKYASSCSSQVSNKLMEDSDSGIYLHQTQFYDTFASATHSVDSALHLSIPLAGEEKKQQFEVTDPSHVALAASGKYSFDPLAPPFKPKGTSGMMSLPYQPTEVRAIDVAKSISTAYQNEIRRKSGLGALGDITNLPSQPNARYIVNRPSPYSEARPSVERSSYQENAPVLRRTNATVCVKEWPEEAIYCKKSFSSGKTSSCNDAAPNSDSIVSSFRELRAVKPLLSKRMDDNFRTVDKSYGYMSRGVVEESYPGFEADKITLAVAGKAIATPSMESTHDRPNIEDKNSGKVAAEGGGGKETKVTFADIVRAGMRAISERQNENNLQQEIPGKNSSGLIGEFKPSAVVSGKINDFDFPREADVHDSRPSYRPSKYRTEPCTTFHTIGVCPYGSRCNFYHEPMEKKEAPTVSKAMRYKTRLCKTWQKAGECPYGVKCDFAHGTNDLASNSPYRPHYKTRMCKVLQQTGRCPYGAQCTFAHKPCELRTDISLIYKYKTEICKSWALGLECSHGNDCHFAHGERELNKDPSTDERF